MATKLFAKAGLFQTVLIGALIVTAVSFASADHLTSTAQPAAASTGPVTLTGLDAHDGTVVQANGIDYLYGTRYGCGYHWLQANTPFCGFGVWSSTDDAHWTYHGLLFDPTGTDSWSGDGGHDWNWVCGSGGQGCFNPRMVQRSSDGTWILWFNAPGDFSRSRANAYYAMGCQGPLGPCGDDPRVGTPGWVGTTHKPALYICSDNGDMSIVQDSGTAYILCTESDQTLAVEKLDQWWTNGVNVGTRKPAGLTNVEAPGAFKNADGTWVLTYSDPNCGYCAGTGTGYATASGLLASWSAPANTGIAAPATGRRDISATSCGGQPRTVLTMNGAPYEWIDLWDQQDGQVTNQTTAGIQLEPLVTNPPFSVTPNGTPWIGGLRPFQC